MAKKKATGALKNGRDSNSKRLGIKIFSNMNVKAGDIIYRQRGKTFTPGYGTTIGRDYTIYSLQNGIVKYYKKVIYVF